MKITRRLKLAVAVVVSTIPLISNANPIPESSIPENVDWFAHLDADKFRSTHVGGMLFAELSNLDPIKENEQLPINPLLVLNGLKGITAFGTIPDQKATKNGDVDVVALITGAPELMQIFRGLISGFQLEQPEAITEIIHGDHTILSMAQAGISGTFLADDQIAISKSMDSLESFLSVKAGKADHLQFGEQFPVPSYDDGMGVYMGVYVEGISGFEQLPAQARILQLTKAVAVQLGESEESLHLLASLVTDVDQTAIQVRDVLNGLVAVMALTQNNEDLASVVQSTNVTQKDNAVTLKVDYPVASAEKWIAVLVEKLNEQMTHENKQADAAEEAELADESADIEPIAEVQPVG